jgi:glycosyltransferase involved in cell wall biosynthesis
MSEDINFDHLDETMYHGNDIKILDYDSLPEISVLIPTYNRRRFIPLITANLYNMDYPRQKIEVCIIDDGKESLFETEDIEKSFRQALHPISINYRRIKNHITIGDKRNKLVKMSKNKICANMDDDDLYMPTYLRYGISVLLGTNSGIVHSPQMTFLFPYDNWKATMINCHSKRQGHEATQIFTKKHFNAMGGYAKNSKGEGAKMIDFHEKNCRCLDIRLCMICICHNENTIDKEFFNKKKNEVDIEIADACKRNIESILNIR